MANWPSSYSNSIWLSLQTTAATGTTYLPQTYPASSWYSLRDPVRMVTGIYDANTGVLIKEIPDNDQVATAAPQAKPDPDDPVVWLRRRVEEVLWEAA